MKRKKGSWGLAALGLLLLAGGLYLIKTEALGFLQALPYVSIGVGCGLFGQGLGALVSARALQKHPELQKRMEIEKNDERNAAIADRAKGKAFDVMTFVFGALMLSFALMDVALAPVLLLVFAYLFVHGCALYYRFKLDKEM